MKKTLISIAILANIHLMADQTGQAYIDSRSAIFLARDLTDEEIDNADNGKGSGYHDGKQAAEEAKNHLARKVYDDGENIVIIPEDGDDDEVQVVEA